MDNQIPEKTKRRAFTVAWIKKAWNVLKEIEKRAYTTENVKLTINSVPANSLNRGVYTKARNNWNGYLKEISVRILLKQLDYSLSISMRR